MALVLAGVGVAAVAGTVVVMESNRGDAATKRSKRAELHSRFPLNTSSVTIKDVSGHLGVTLRDAFEGKGVVILSLDEQDAFAKAGLSVGDWIVSINGQLVEGHAECLMIANAFAKQGAPIQINYMTQTQIQCDLSALHKKGEDRAHLGLSLRTEPGKRGALVIKLEAKDLLANSGLHVGDVITHVGGKRVYDHENAMHELTKYNWFKSKNSPPEVEIKFMTATA